MEISAVALLLLLAASLYMCSVVVDQVCRIDVVRRRGPRVGKGCTKYVTLLFTVIPVIWALTGVLT